MSTVLANPNPIAIYIDPPSHHFLGDKLFEDDSARLNGDQQNAPYRIIRERYAKLGIQVRTADYLPAVPGSIQNFYFSMGRLETIDKIRARPDIVCSGFFALECPIVEPSLYRALPQISRKFRRVFSWSDSESLRRFTGADLALASFRWPQSFDSVHQSIWANEQREFLVMINGNKLPRVYWQELYSERMRAVQYFSQFNEVHLYGKGWDQPPVRVGKTWLPWTVKLPLLAVKRAWQTRFPSPLYKSARAAWRGSVASKAETLGRYKFALCFENCVLRGWITEKIFDCMFAGTVPIYWGAPEIAEIIPSECFIDMRNFANYGELRSFLHSRTESDLRAYRNAAQNFLSSGSYSPFQSASLAELIERCVAEDLPTARA